MMFYQVGPECAGSVGDDSVFEDESVRPVRMSKFQFELNFWPEDDLIVATVQGYAGTERLSDAIKAAGLTGIEFDELDMVEGEQFFIHKKDRYGEILPKYLWFKLVGKPGLDDFGVIPGPVSLPLVVSERALHILATFDFKLAKVRALDTALVVEQRRHLR